MIRPVLFILALFVPADAWAQALTVIEAPGPVSDLARTLYGGIEVSTADGRTFRLGFDDTGPTFAPAVIVPGAGRPRSGMIPGGAIATGAGDIRQAWLIDPTERYGHGVLGDGIEAGGVRAVLADGMVVQLRLPEGEVFEDLTPRIADADGDGRDELVLVLSSVAEGAALAVLEVNRAGIVVAARTPFIGAPHRWLNPVGVADLDGDGAPEIAYVETPHIGGVLKVWRMRDGGLAELAALPGYSNHAIGLTALGMSAVADVTGDGLADMVVPGADRESLKAVSMAGGAPSVAWEIALPDAVSTNIEWTEWRGAPAVVFGLADGRLAVVGAS